MCSEAFIGLSFVFLLVSVHLKSIIMDDKNKPEQTQDTENTEVKKKGSGIFTVDGKELPDIPGGYDLVEPDSGLGDSDFVDR